MKKSTKYLFSFIVFGFTLTLITCSNFINTNQISDSDLITNNIIKLRMNKKVNLLYIWTSWCGISKKILKEEYSKLCNSNNKDFSVTIICADNKFDKVNNNCSIYGIEQKTNSFPNSHRKIIKNFILSNFKNTESIELKGSFGLPISLFISDSLEIISIAPQKTEDIIRLAKYYNEN